MYPGGWDFIRADDGLTQHGAFEAWYASTLQPSTNDDDGESSMQQQEQEEHRHKQSGAFPCLGCCFEGKMWGDDPTPHIKVRMDRVMGCVVLYSVDGSSSHSYSLTENVPKQTKTKNRR